MKSRKILTILGIRQTILSSHELDSVGRDIAYIMKEPEFEPRTLHLFTFKVEFLATTLLNQK
jgi:glucuronate isomerase